ncbi:MAG: hypothetical protein ACLU5C_10945 [Acutalibacter sp.]
MCWNLVVAVVLVLMYASSAERNVVIRCAVQQVSSAAQEEGCRFSACHTADVEVSGNNLLTGQLSASDFEIAS